MQESKQEVRKLNFPYKKAEILSCVLSPLKIHYVKTMYICFQLVMYLHTTHSPILPQLVRQKRR